MPESEAPVVRPHRVGRPRHANGSPRAQHGARLQKFVPPHCIKPSALRLAWAEASDEQRSLWRREQLPPIMLLRAARRFGLRVVGSMLSESGQCGRLELMGRMSSRSPEHHWPNQRLERSGQQRTCWVPFSLRSSAPAPPQR